MDDDGWEPGRIGSKTCLQGSHVGQLSGMQTGRKLLCQLAFAVALMSHGQELDHDTAGLTFCQMLDESVEGSPVCQARKQLVAIDESEERHRLAAERMDDMAVVDDLVVLARGISAPTWQRREVGASDEEIEPIVEQAYPQSVAYQA